MINLKILILLSTIFVVKSKNGPLMPASISFGINEDFIENFFQAIIIAT
jgi:hypothetical protein